jgi:hypothetical protein
MKLSNMFMFVMRITMAGMMCLALLGALHMSNRLVLAAPAHQTSGLNEANENVEEQEGENNDVNESNDDQNENIDAQEGQQGQNEDSQNNDENESVDEQQDAGVTP